MHLITLNNTKTVKGQGKGYLTGILHLAPANLSGYNVCKFSTKGCRELCLNRSGFGRYNKIQLARIRRTKMLFEEPDRFLTLLEADIISLINKAKKRKLKPVVRLDGTSDLGLSEKLFKLFPEVKFYDYTKDPIRYKKWLENPDERHLIFSRSEKNDKTCLEILSKGGSVAVVFESLLPKTWNGYQVIDGDLNDLRFKDRKNVVVGLRMKKVGKPANGFIYQNIE